MPHLPVILMADDSVNDSDLALEALAEYSLANQVIVVRDGIEALNFLLRRGRFADHKGPHPVLFLLDIKMPRVDGLEVLREMRKHPELSSIPVILLSSSREEPDLAEARRLGATAYIVKPVGFHDFADAIKTVGKFWAVLNALQPSMEPFPERPAVISMEDCAH
jgi:two-component system response regulator